MSGSMILRSFKAIIRSQYEKAINLKPAFRIPYASHLPVLFAVGVLTDPKRVVEYGSGGYSTTAFLSEKAFRNLECIHSFENDKTWYEQMRAILRNDTRVSLDCVEGQIAQIVTHKDLSLADLVFIDDSMNLERALTIKAVAKTRVINTPILIHDVNIRQFRRLTKQFDHRFIFDALNPQTGVVWNGEWPPARHLASLNTLIAESSDDIEPDHAERWSLLFRRALADDHEFALGGLADS